MISSEGKDDFEPFLPPQQIPVNKKRIFKKNYLN